MLLDQGKYSTFQDFNSNFLYDFKKLRLFTQKGCISASFVDEEASGCSYNVVKKLVILYLSRVKTMSYTPELLCASVYRVFFYFTEIDQSEKFDNSSTSLSSLHSSVTCSTIIQVLIGCHTNEIRQSKNRLRNKNQNSTILQHSSFFFFLFLFSTSCSLP